MLPLQVLTNLWLTPSRITKFGSAALLSNTSSNQSKRMLFRFEQMAKRKLGDKTFMSELAEMRLLCGEAKK